MMKKLYFTIICLGLMSITTVAQKLYTVTSGEMIFSNSQAEFTQEFLTKYPGANLASNNVRFTVFFHVGQNLHYDFSNSVGMYTGLAIRNIGIITDETLPEQVGGAATTVTYNSNKIIRRQYALGLPLAFKFGAFDKNLHFFAGAEYEMAFHFKEKYWTGSFDRSDAKTKNTEWFSSQTPTFLPSVLGGVQFPGGVNIKFKYYLNDFLDSSYHGNGNAVEGSPFDISDQSRYAKSNMFYLSLCWQFNTGDIMGDK